MAISINLALFHKNKFRNKITTVMKMIILEYRNDLIHYLCIYFNANFPIGFGIFPSITYMNCL